MTKTLHAVVHSLAAWAEGCHCHEPFARGRRRYARFKALSADFGKEHYGCPLEAMRFPELVAGGLIEAQNDIQQIAQVDLLHDSSIWCNPAEWQLVLSDFRMAQAAFALDFKIKTSFVHKLPWICAGLAHHDPAVVRRIAEEALSLYDATPAELQEYLHPLAHKFLSPRRRLRKEVQSLAAGVLVSSLSTRAKRNIARFRFLNLSERIIEAGHKDIKTEAGHHKLKEVSVSTALRCSTVLECQLQIDPSVLKEVVKCIWLSRSPSEAMRLLHLEGHPAMVELRRLDAEGSHPQTSAWQTTLARVLYRCDGHTVFGTMELQAGKHKRAVAREDGRVGRLTKVQKALNQGELLAYTFIDHLREVLSVGDVFSFPPGSWRMSSLDADLAHQPQVRPQAPAAARLIEECSLDQDMVAVQEAPGPPRCFMRVLNKHPSNLRTIRMSKAVGGKVSDRSIAVVQINVLANAEEGPTVDMSHGAEVALISDFSAGDIEACRFDGGDALLWPSGDAVVNYHMSHFVRIADSLCAAEDLSWALEQLLMHQATPCSEKRLSLSSNHYATKVLLELKDGGFVAQENTDQPQRLWSLTRRGMEHLRFATQLVQEPISLTLPRSAPELAL
mgnify:FL=1